MTVTTAAAACGYAPCSRPVERAATGLLLRYCSPNCRQAAHRERVRQAEEEARRRAELAAAKAAVVRLWPQVEVAALDVSETADAVLAYAAHEDPEDRGALLFKLAELRAHVDRLAELALAFRGAEDRQAELSVEGLVRDGR